MTTDCGRLQATPPVCCNRLIRLLDLDTWIRVDPTHPVAHRMSGACSNTIAQDVQIWFMETLDPEAVYLRLPLYLHMLGLAMTWAPGHQAH